MELSARSGMRMRPRRADPITWESLRYTVFFSLMALLWLFPNPNAVSFREDPGAGREGTLFIQLLWMGLLASSILLCQSRWPQVRRQFDATMLLMLAWCLLTVPFAIIPDVAMRRFIFTAMAMFVMVFLVGSFERPQAVLILLLVALVVETIAKYVFVFGIPSLGRHTFNSLEPHLAGLWRGQYAHKNVAGPICAIELFILYAARYRIPTAYLIGFGGLQVIFLAMSGSKTPIALAFLVMMLAKLMLRLNGIWSLLAVASGTVIAINSMTILTVMSDDMRKLVAVALGDASYTGRADIWGILLSYAADHLWMGAGFMSFWQIGFLSPAMQDARSWASNAIYGHQGYLDLVVTIGVPGLLLTFLFVILRPCADIAAIRYRSNPVLEMFVSFWLFGLLHNGTESNLLGRADAVWLFIIIAIVGIRRLRIDEVDAKAVPRSARPRGLAPVPVAATMQRGSGGAGVA